MGLLAISVGYWEPNMKDKLMNLHQVKLFSGLGATTIYRYMQEGHFPKPIKLGRTTRWVESELIAWLEAKKAERDS